MNSVISTARVGAEHAASGPGLGPPRAACCWALLQKPGPSTRHLNALCLLSRSELSRTRLHHFTTTIGLGSKLGPRPSLLMGFSAELGNSGAAEPVCQRLRPALGGAAWWEKEQRGRIVGAASFSLKSSYFIFLGYRYIKT